jgi:hypothetical protein
MPDDTLVLPLRAPNKLQKDARPTCLALKGQLHKTAQLFGCVVVRPINSKLSGLCGCLAYQQHGLSDRWACQWQMPQTQCNPLNVLTLGST